MKTKEKQFVAQPSLLTQLHETKGFRAIYNLALMILGLQSLRLLVTTYLDNGSIDFGQKRIFHSFATLHYAAAIWTGMQVFVLLKYCTFKAQAFTRRFIRKIGPLLMFDIVNDVLTYSYCFLLFPGTVVLCVLKYDLAFADSFAIMMELMRFMMKLYAFIATVKVRKEVPAFGKYLYFLFAPTLIYRDEYPRTEQIRWKFVGVCFLEFLAAILCFSLMCDLYPSHALINFGRAPLTWSDFVELLFSGVLVSLVGIFVTSYGLFHAWMNGMAEVMRFADRRFYEDWWTSTSVLEYFRRWNIIVYDFIHYYAYRHLRLVFSQSTTFFIVFFTSAVLHDALVCVAFRMVYPVMFCIYVFQLCYACPLKNYSLKNYFWWSFLTVGVTLIVTLTLVEFFARKNCDASDRFWMPVSWWCNGLITSH